MPRHKAANWVGPGRKRKSTQPGTNGVIERRRSALRAKNHRFRGNAGAWDCPTNRPARHNSATCRSSSAVYRTENAGGRAIGRAIVRRHLKQTLHIDVLRTKSVDGSHKELAMFAIVYNLVRLVMLEAAQRQGVMPDRISFVDALRWLAAAGTGLPLRRIRVLPLRPDRHERRVRKRRPKNYPFMT
jgi:hypothetical protein